MTIPQLPSIPPLTSLPRPPSLASLADSLKSGAGITNPANKALDDITSTLGGVNKTLLGLTELTAITNMLEAAKNQAATVAKNIAQLPFMLPLMKAADDLAAKTKIMQGITPAAGGGEGIKSLTTGITGSSAQLNALSATITGGIGSSIPGDPASLAASLASANSAMDQHVTDAATAAASAKAAAVDSINNLKSYAFAKFISSPQPPEIKALLSQVVPPANVPTAFSVAHAENTANKVMSAQYGAAYVQPKPERAITEPAYTPPVVTSQVDIPSPVVTDSALEELVLNLTYAIGLKVLEERDAAFAWKDTEVALVKYRDGRWPTCMDIKAKALAGDPEAVAQYAIIKEDIHRTKEWLDHVDTHTKYWVIKKELDRLTAKSIEWRMRDHSKPYPGPPW